MQFKTYSRSDQSDLTKRDEMEKYSIWTVVGIVALLFIANLFEIKIF